MSSYYDLSEVIEGVSGLHGKHCPMQGKVQKQFVCRDRGDKRADEGGIGNAEKKRGVISSHST